MKQLFILYNPNSSRFSDVKKEVLNRQKDLRGYLVGKYEVEKTDVDKNAAKFAKLLKDGDFVIAAGGDATGVIAVNAILKSEKDVTLAVLPFGNFNDLSRTLGTSSFESISPCIGDQDSFFEGGPERGSARSSAGRPWRWAGRTRPEKKESGSRQNYYPLEIYVDGNFFRYATCYVTIGMMGEAVKLYDSPSVRKKLKTNFGRKISSYTSLASWYFKNRHKKVFLPEFKLNGKLQSKKTSDYAAINGKYMARVMKGGDYYKKPKTFLHETDRLTNFWRLFKLMAKSILSHIPGTITESDILEFLEPSSIEIQAEGEYKTFDNVKKIEIRKSEKCLKVITKN